MQIFLHFCAFFTLTLAYFRKKLYFCGENGYVGCPLGAELSALCVRTYSPLASGIPASYASHYPSLRKAAEDAGPPARCSMRVCALSVCALRMATHLRRFPEVIVPLWLRNCILDHSSCILATFLSPLYPFVISSLRHYVMTFL